MYFYGVFIICKDGVYNNINLKILVLEKCIIFLKYKCMKDIFVYKLFEMFFRGINFVFVI